MTNAPKTVLAIHDLPGFGRAALSVIVPVLSTLGVQTVALPTAVLSTHTGGLGTPAKLANPGYGPAALEHYHRLGVKFDCIYSGYLADAAQAKLVEQAFELWPRAFKVVDPVLGDGGRLYSGLGADMVPAMSSLCSKADLIVPNVTEASLLLAVFDASRPWDELDDRVLSLCEGREAIAILNKTDLPQRMELSALQRRFPSPVRLCAATGEGLPELERRLCELYLPAPDEVLLTSLRHAEAAGRAREAVRRAREAIEQGVEPDIAEVDLREAIEALGEITGESVTQDVIDSIFSRFCVGK